VSSFGALNKQTDIKYLNSRRDQLKINLDSKKIIMDDGKKYETEKKPISNNKNLIIKTKSTSKFEPRQSL